MGRNLKMTLPHITRSHFLYLGKGKGGGWQVLRLSKQDTAQSKYGSGQGLRGHTLLSLLASCLAWTSALQNQARWSSPEPCPRERQREPPPPLAFLAWCQYQPRKGREGRGKEKWERRGAEERGRKREGKNVRRKTKYPEQIVWLWG